MMNILLNIFSGFAIAAVLAAGVSLGVVLDQTVILIFLLTLVASITTLNTLRYLGVPQIARVSVMAGVCALSVLGTKTDFRSAGPETALAAVATSSVPRERDGHFRADAIVAGGAVEVLVDTGASIVLLTWEDAVNTGIDLKALTFDLPVLTANGQSFVAGITLDTVAIGNVEVHNVRAAVAQPGQLHASLLGMSFLGEIEEAVIRKDALILRN